MHRSAAHSCTRTVQKGSGDTGLAQFAREGIAMDGQEAGRLLLVVAGGLHGAADGEAFGLLEGHEGLGRGLWRRIGLGHQQGDRLGRLQARHVEPLDPRGQFADVAGPCVAAQGALDLGAHPDGRTVIAGREAPASSRMLARRAAQWMVPFGHIVGAQGGRLFLRRG